LAESVKPVAADVKTTVFDGRKVRPMNLTRTDAHTALSPNPTALGSPFDSSVVDGPFAGEARLEGRLPPWLRGTLLRTAPALFELGAWKAAHWFDALGMLYALDLTDDGVRFRQRLLDGDALTHARAGRMPVSTFATPNERSFLRRVFEPIPTLTDNANVHVIPTPDGWLAMTETPWQRLVDGATLTPLRTVRYDDAVGAGAPMLAHPEYDRARREIVNVAIKIGRRVELVPFRQTLGAYTRTPIAKATLDDIPYLHAFGMTPTKILLAAPPLRAKTTSLLWSNRGYIDHFVWDAKRPTDFFIIDRATGDVRRAEGDAMFFFHTVNAFDDGDDVVLDLCAYRDASLIDRLRVPSLRGDVTNDARLCRVRMPAKGGRATYETLDASYLEFPTVNRAALAGARHSVVWGAALGHDGAVTTSTVRRIDLERGTATQFTRDRVVYGEPVFVRRPGGAGESDGVLLSVGSDLARRCAELVVLDAERLEPLATARLPIALPLGFHGSFQRAKGADDAA